MAGKPRRYTARYTHNPGGVWTVQLIEEPGVISQGRSIPEARRHIREALALWLDDEAAADAAELVDDVILPREARSSLTRYTKLRAAAEAARRKTDAEQVALARLLTQESGLSLADAGDLLGVTRQRVHQLVDVKAAAPRLARALMPKVASGMIYARGKTARAKAVTQPKKRAQAPVGARKQARG
jgi:predicted RNase H-like HicB family nuclease